ncbi:cupin [Synechocystis sp. LKSZ1]|uniref:cysteine dioxygenase family protein n=1 Tax=Synechocystis sp. LKSZ1 TaxID=3144951 RepID=UPI00336BDDCE
MTCRDWFVNAAGICQPRPKVRTWDLLRENYYLHQFLTEVLAIVAQAANEQEEWDYLPQIRQKVRQLLTNSYWVKTQHHPPDPKTGVHVTTLYDEIGYPLTVQNVATRPGTGTAIHNHGAWGVLFQIQGTDHHTFWHRVNAKDEPLQIEPIGEYVLTPEEIISFHPDAIHQVTTIGTETAVTFQLYGDSHAKGRFQFEPMTQTAKNF